MDTFLHTGGDLENDSLPYRKPVRLCRSDVMWNAVGIIYGLRIRSADDSRTLAKRGLMRIRTAISSAAYVFFQAISPFGQEVTFPYAVLSLCPPYRSHQQWRSVSFGEVIKNLKCLSRSRLKK